MKKSKRYQMFMILIVIAAMLIAVPIALTETDEEKDNKIIFKNFETCELFEIESEEESVVEIGAGFIDLEDYQGDTSGEDVLGERIRIVGEGTVHFNDDNKFTYVTDLVGDYQILDEEGNVIEEVSSIEVEDVMQPITVYNDYDTFKNDYANCFDDTKFEPDDFRDEEGNIIYAGFKQDLIIGRGYFDLDMEGDEEHIELDVTSGITSFENSAGSEISGNSDNSLFVYENSVKGVYGIGVISIDDGTSEYVSTREYLYYQKERTDTEDSVTMDIVGEIPPDDINIQVAMYTKEARVSDGEYIDLIHYIIPTDQVSLKLVHNSASFNEVATAIKEGKEVELDRITTITLPDSTNPEKTYFLDDEGLNGYYIGPDGSKVNFYSVDGIKFKTCAEAGEPCDFITCCAGPEYCIEQGTESIMKSQKNKICDPEAPEEIDSELDEEGNPIVSGDGGVAGEFPMEGECVPLSTECEPCHEFNFEPEVCMCEFICGEDEECLGEEGFEQCYVTECEENEEFDYEELECVIVECEPGFELDRYGECVPIECPEGEEYDVEKEECVAMKEMPVLELLLNGDSGDLVLEEDDDKTVTILGRVIEGDYSARISIKIDGDEIRSGRDEIETTYTFAEEGRYSISFEYPESERYLTDSVRHQVIVKSTDEGPVWLEHGSDPISDSAYSESQEYEFWVKWQDASGIKKVEFENDFSGTTSKQTITEEGGKYTYTTMGIEIGTYNYKWFATNNEDITSSTDVILYKVGKGEPSITVTINGEVVEEVIQMYKQTQEATIKIILNEPTNADMIIKLDGQTQGGTEFVAPLDQFGYYALSVKVLETPSYTSREFIKYINITQLDPDVLIKINDISNQEIVEVTDPDVEFNITLLEPEEGSVSFYINNEPIQIIDDTIDYSFKLIRSLELGEYEIKATFDGTEVYRELSFVKTVNVVEP